MLKEDEALSLARVFVQPCGVFYASNINIDLRDACDAWLWVQSKISHPQDKMSLEHGLGVTEMDDIVLFAHRVLYMLYVRRCYTTTFMSDGPYGMSVLTNNEDEGLCWNFLNVIMYLLTTTPC
jgi:hypothetical protein